MTSNRLLRLSALLLLTGFLLPLSATLTQAQNWACKGKTGCTTPGAACPDDTVFAGCTGGNIPFYVTRCDGGFVWNGSSCTGSASTYAWNSGTTNYTTTSATNAINGQTNTHTLVTTDSDSSTGGTQLHNAANYCDTLAVHGRTDWYLPSVYEMTVVYINYAAIGNFAAADYWASSEVDSSNANFFRGTSPSYIGYTTKNTASRIRCARRD